MTPDAPREDGHANRWRLGFTAALVIVTIFVVFVGWATRASNQDAKVERLCRAIVQVATSGNDPANLKPGQYGYSYAQEHPDEVANYQAANPARIAEALGCPEPKEKR